MFPTAIPLYLPSMVGRHVVLRVLPPAVHRRELGLGVIAAYCTWWFAVALVLQSAAKNFSASIASFWDSYQRTEKKVKIVDLFLVYAMATALVQFTYCLLVGNFPFNSFLSGFGCALGVFILGGTVQRWARGCGCRHSIFLACPPLQPCACSARGWARRALAIVRHQR